MFTRILEVQLIAANAFKRLFIQFVSKLRQAMAEEDINSGFWRLVVALEQGWSFPISHQT